MNKMPLSWVTRPFGELNKFYGTNIDPASHPAERFELYSIPAFPTGKPEQPLGSEVGSTKQMVEHNDILISKINPRINRVWQVGPSMGLRQIASSEWIGFRSPQMDARFFRYYFTGPIFRDLLCSDVTGVGGSLTRAQPKRVAGFPVPVAPVDEQKRIADKLDTVLTRVDAVNTRLARVAPILKRFRQSVLAAATSGQLTEDWRRSNADGAVHPQRRQRHNKSDPPPDIKSLNIPATWRVQRAQDVVEADANIVYGIVQPGPKLISGIPYVQTTDIADGRIQVDSLCRTSADIANRYHRSSIKGGDVLLGIIRATKVAVVPDELSGGNISRSVARLRPCSEMVPQFLAIALRSPAVQDWLRAQHRGMDMPVLNLAQVRLAPLPIAPIDEQREIVRRVENLFAFADRLEARLRTARTATERLPQALLAKAFRGELVPQDPNDEPASELLRRMQQEAPSTSIKRGRKSAA